MYSLSKFPIQIPRSKTKYVLLLLASLILVIAGICLLINHKGEMRYFFGSQLTILITAILSILFFGTKSVYMFLQLLDQSPALEISEYGITDHYSKADAGLIKWEDIKEIQVITVFHNRILMIVLNNPELYINRQSHPIAQKAMEMNYQMYGSPVGLSAMGLKINFTSLKILLNESLYKFKKH